MNVLSVEQIEKLTPEEQADYLNLINKYEDAKKYNQLNFFKPYEFQKKFYDKGKDNSVRALIAANRCGKTYSAAMEIAMHLTGKYPDWWTGRKFNKPIRCVMAGVTSSQVKDVLQKEMIGTANRNIVDEIGTGTIPKDDIDLDSSIKAQGGAFSEVYVKHLSGGSSSIKFFGYSQGMEPMQGFTADIAYIDEQAPDDIFSELVKRTATVQGMTVATFTPLQGVTHLVKQFWEPDGAFYSGMVNAGWNDVTHLTEDAKKQMLAATPPHLVDAVTKGIPVLGAGAVFNFSEQDILYDEIEIKEDWEHICGLDIGFTNDPTAAILAARDQSTGTIYIYDEYGNTDNNVLPPNQHVGPLHAKRCNEIPVIYDSAANARTGASGAAVSDMYRDMGINMLKDSFKNPKVPGQYASSYKAVKVGLTKMIELFSTGKLKVHSRNCPNWWREFRSYSYDERGEPSQKDNHWMDASRYAVMSILRDLGEPIKVTKFDWQNRHDEWRQEDEFSFNII